MPEPKDDEYTTDPVPGDTGYGTPYAPPDEDEAIEPYLDEDEDA